MKFMLALSAFVHIGKMISVVIPTYNAQETLPRCFDSLIGATVHGVVREVVVADGGSTDETMPMADAVGARVVLGGPSRALQLDAGAKASRGEWILFLYPETALAPGWEVEAGCFMARVPAESPYAAAFSFALEEFDASARRAEALAGLRSRLFKLPYGDQGLLIPRKLYAMLGGFRDVAMPDADMIRRIGAKRLVILRARAVNRAFERPPEQRRFLLASLYALRFPPSFLARMG